MRVLAVLASLKLTLTGMLALGCGILVSYLQPTAGAMWLTVPLAGLAVNLLAALIVNPRFKHQAGLMVFHVALLAVMLLVAFGRITHLKARVEISEGQHFDPSNVSVIQKGPWHPWEELQTVAFAQGAIQVDYAPWLVRGQTSSQIWLSDGSATRVAAHIGDTVPLKTGNYRFYTTSNKGFAAVLSWRDDAGRVQAGAIHFPSYPLFDWNQLSQWTTPAGTSLELALIPPNPVAEDQSWTLDSRQAEGSLLVKGLAQTTTLMVGDSLRLPGGQLRFEAVRMWMGYEIFYDPTLAWLFAAALVGILGLGWHFWGKLWSRPLLNAMESAASTNGRDISLTRI